ncbi:MAG: coproporphyrinogen dehydrogenase HemZ [Roseburia sp.]|nr:coproporphyrinogen dehydrogenase HemZ [Roseburia sp.]
MSTDIKNNTELADVARLFFGDDFPHIEVAADCGNTFGVFIDGKQYAFTYDGDAYGVIPQAHRTTRLSKIALYDALSAHTGRKMIWGALTGVRPTKLFYECLNGGYSLDECADILKTVYRIDGSRAEILKEIVTVQSGKVRFPSDCINLYVHIPYCTTRCTYCSFVSTPIDKNMAQAERYVDLLCDEVKRSLDFLYAHGKKILSVYIGGGTPTALDDGLLRKLLDGIGVHDCEYTCEAGRPDTVTESKADIIKEHGVTRVCVNPQTLNDATLAAIGRRHTAEDFFRAFETVKSRGFDINCDLIAGLADETLDIFIESFEKTKALKPQNITVHSLSKKNGSEIRYAAGENACASEMTDYALSHLGDYRPYYLYRQKRQAGNLENVGFSLPDKECINNITTMEESVGVMACGAGAISKIVKGGNIVRFANMRDVALYIDRYEEKLKAKFDCFENN